MVCSKNGLDVMDGLEMIPDYHSTELTQVKLDYTPYLREVKNGF